MSKKKKNKPKKLSQGKGSRSRVIDLQSYRKTYDKIFKKKK